MDNDKKRQKTTMYQKGKIYKLVDNTNGNIYIGSTIQSLTKRKSQHKAIGNNKCMSKLIIANGDYDIILIENYPCDSKDELLKRERYYIDNTDCINKTLPGRTGAEWYQDNKERLLDKAKNKVKTDERKEYEKNYAEKNKDIINEKSQIWYKNNKEKKAEYDKKYREDNKEKRIEYDKKRNELKKKNKPVYNQKVEIKKKREWEKSMGGRKDAPLNNSLLKIDINLFN